jgi:hypothetical protein
MSGQSEICNLQNTSIAYQKIGSYQGEFFLARVVQGVAEPHTFHVPMKNKTVVQIL